VTTGSSPWPREAGPLLLRAPRVGDAEQVLRFRNDAGVNRFMVHTHVDPDDLRRDLVEAVTSPTDHSCVAELAERDGEVVAIGFLELRRGSGQPRPAALEEALIGYVVDPVHAGQGVGSALARGLLDAAFDLGARRVVAACFADNPASVRILEGLGMRRERHGVQALWHAELGWVDEYEYAMLASERSVPRSRPLS
jgi:RimJ/RimL family protein N-acetyltransferase